MIKTKLLTAALATVTALVAVPAAAHADDYFMRVTVPAGQSDVINGESQDAEFPQTIEIDSFSFQAESTVTIGSSTGGAGAGKAQFNELEIEKPVDSTTPQFFQRMASGRHLAMVEIIARRASPTGKGGAYPIRYLFTTVAVKSQKQSGSDGEAPRETLTLLYGGVAQAATHPSNPLKPTVFSNWSQVSNSLIKDVPLPTPFR